MLVERTLRRASCVIYDSADVGEVIGRLAPAVRRGCGQARSAAVVVHSGTP